MFNRSEMLNSYNKVNTVLCLERKVVGVKFLFTKREFDNDPADKMSNKLTYCAMVRRAAEGEVIKADFDNFACFGGARALGIVDVDEFYTSGRFFEGCGLYPDLSTARAISEKMSICDHNTYGITVKPLNMFEDRPDLVVFITNPRNAMRIVQGYTYYFGTKENYKLIGNQAICSEATARPYLINDINLTVLCKGPRSNGYKDDEMAIGMVFNKFTPVVEGVCMTLTPVENNIDKEILINRLKENGIDDVQVIKDRNYNTFFYRRDYEYFNSKRKCREDAEENLPNIWRSVIDEKNSKE